jgi:hypothetical protein
MTRSSEGLAPRGAIAAPPRSIVVVGDDPLMVRALNRLLRTAGYRVGGDEHGVARVPSVDRRENRVDAELTIVDIPDDWHQTEAVLPSEASSLQALSQNILWISAEPRLGEDPTRFLVKPFTSIQLLDKVRALLSSPTSSAH